MNSFVTQADDPTRIGETTPYATVTLQPNGSPEVRGQIVRERLNAAARPILYRFARRRGMRVERLQDVIDGSMPLTHPEIVSRMGGALYSEDMRSVIAINADPALVPLKVRSGIAKMTAQAVCDVPPATVQEAFPDWNKPLVPRGGQLQPWRPEDAAIWLERFPPNEGLLHPIDTWDAATAALWLNDRDADPSDRACENELDGTVVAFSSERARKPSLEVLHTLHGLELEALTYRVFVERLRREVMPFYVNERRIYIRQVAELIAFGYLMFDEARRSVRTHDLRRIRYFDQVFGENDEWIYDLDSRIVAAYAWPDGFDETVLQMDFEDLYQPSLSRTHVG